MSYPTLDYLSDLTYSEMSNARQLTFTPYDSSSVGWDYSATAYGSEPYALLHDTYQFTAVAGATYDFFSTSYFDPYILIVYDQYGNAVLANNEYDDPADHLLSDGGYYSSDAEYDWVAPYTGTFYVSASWHQGSYYSFYSLSVYEDADTIPPTGGTYSGTAANDYTVGSNGDDLLYGYAGDDVLTGGYGNDWIDGGTGTDTLILGGSMSSYTISPVNSSPITVSGPDGTDTLVGIERIQVGGYNVAIDINGAGGEAYRLYQAAFNRHPDLGGLGYWIHALDGGTTLHDAAASFVGSAEFISMYGSNPTSASFVNNLYINVLHREADAGGSAFWQTQLDQHLMDRATVLASFSESPENQANVIADIQYGMLFTPF